LWMECWDIDTTHELFISIRSHADATTPICLLVNIFESLTFYFIELNLH